MPILAIMFAAGIVADELLRLCLRRLRERTREWPIDDGGAV